ncbi:hypothetical protein RND81_09G038500 [Saponaria officinalis]|uniref:F-box/LRR-repeat protein 15/At3g58940/PEG3-like LRR domain-containing protein n=1 Tax=Saponaria officinalis TaxID=3572 RepID=A0AAW1IIG5_SAPOF
MMDCIKLSNLMRFRINSTGNGGQCFDGQVESWLVAILSHGIQEIDLCFDIRKLPDTIFTCKTLCVLKLNTNAILEPLDTVCLPCLRILHLKKVVVFDEGYTNKLLLGCPFLHDFRVDSYALNVPGQLSISAPSLTNLKLNITRVSLTISLGLLLPLLLHCCSISTIVTT